jgi:ABC-type Fe3+-hydroxamate transport system substrate-binding protein
MAEACTGESSSTAGVAELYRDILLLGRIFGVEQRAQELVAGLQRDIG